MNKASKIVMSLVAAVLLILMVYIITAVLAKPQYGMTYVVAPEPTDWRPPVERCPADTELWDCVRFALYAQEGTHGAP